MVTRKEDIPRGVPTQWPTGAYIDEGIPLPSSLLHPPYIILPGREMLDFDPFDEQFEESVPEVRTPSTNDDDVTDDPRRHKVNNRYAYVTYAQCTITAKDDFEVAFKSILPLNAIYFGGRELHEDGGIHYHVVVSFRKKVHWKDGRQQFKVPGNECKSINIQTPKKGQRIQHFLSRTQDYCDKDGDTFGERILAGRIGAKRKFDDIESSKTRGEAKKLKDFYPEKFICHPNVKSYPKHKFDDPNERVEYEHDTKEFDQPFRSVPALDDFVENNITNPVHGRKKSVLVVGRGGEGKTGWARSLGKHKYIDTRWTPTVIQQPGSYIVLDGIHDRFPEWKVILGAQRTITAKIMRKDPVTLPWDMPCIWLCNPDNDPRKWGSDVRKYIERMCIVYELGEGEKMYQSDKGRVTDV